MRLPQLSLRELFLLVVIAAMGCGWWVEHWRMASLAKDKDVWESRANALKYLIELKRPGSSVEWKEGFTSVTGLAP